MAVEGSLWLAKHLSLTLISVFLTEFRYFSYKVATKLSSRRWVDPVPEPILGEKFLGYSWESNPGPLGWQSDVLTTNITPLQSINFHSYLTDHTQPLQYLHDVHILRNIVNLVSSSSLPPLSPSRSIGHPQSQLFLS